MNGKSLECRWLEMIWINRVLQSHLSIARFNDEDNDEETALVKSRVKINDYPRLPRRHSERSKSDCNKILIIIIIIIIIVVAVVGNSLSSPLTRNYLR
jgi:t-SNARE complex subunit (syntaxin)